MFTSDLEIFGRGIFAKFFQYEQASWNVTITGTVCGSYFSGIARFYRLSNAKAGLLGIGIYFNSPGSSELSIEDVFVDFNCVLDFQCSATSWLKARLVKSEETYKSALQYACISIEMSTLTSLSIGAMRQWTFQIVSALPEVYVESGVNQSVAVDLSFILPVVQINLLLLTDIRTPGFVHTHRVTDIQVRCSERDHDSRNIADIFRQSKVASTEM